MSEEKSDQPINIEIQNQTTLGLSRITDGKFPALSEIIKRSLVHIQTSKTLSRIHRIGDHELCGPDYNLVCNLSEDLNLCPEEVLSELMFAHKYGNSIPNWDVNFTRIIDGRFKSLCLYCNNTKITSFPKIKGLVIEKLDFSWIQNLDIDLTILTFLDTLSCENCDLDYFNISSIPNLKKLSCSGNHLQQLDLTQVPHLKELWCNDNELIELNLSTVTKLEKLSFVSNKFADIDLSFVPNLTYLDCSANFDLKNIDLSSVPNLKELFCFHIYASELDLLQVRNLRKLRCDGNMLSELDISGLSMLSELCCMANQISKLDLSTVPNLTELWCGFNNLSELDLSAVPRLKKLHCDGNQLTSLDISMLPNLYVLHCEDNLLHKIDISKMKKTTGYLEMLELRCDDHVLITHRPDQRI